MVIRAILRNIQNTLVLSSALLVIMALQRLQHYEFRTDNFLLEEQQHHLHQQQEGEGEGINELDEMHESLDNFRLGMNRHVRFEAPFHVGLFQFSLPTLERIILTDQSTTKATAALKQDWEITEIQTLVHYFVDLSGHEGNCHLLDAAAVFAHSLGTKKDVLHAIVNETMVASCNATSWLSSVGYNVIPSESISLYGTCTEPWQAYALQNLTHVDVVVRVPATTVSRHDNNNNNDPSAVSKNKKLTATGSSQGNIRKRRRTLSSSTYSSLQSIQLLRPKSAAAAAAVSKNDCRTPTVCQSSPCRIVKHTSLHVPPRKCPLPWTCPNNYNSTEMGISSCRVYHDLWQAQRSEMVNDLEVCDGNGKYQSILRRSKK